MASQNPVQDIKEKLDIVEIIRGCITLTPAGKNFKAPCPFHKEKTPSFMVSPDRQTWHCFGSCGEGGDVFSFVMKYENLEFYEALKLLAEKAGIELRRVSPQDQKQFGILYDIQEAAKNFFKETLRDDKIAKEYLSSRGLKDETIQEFEIGLAPYGFDKLTLSLINNGFSVSDIERAGLAFKSDRGSYVDRFRGRVMFPIHNHFGKIVGFSGRILPQYEKEDTGKYVNSPETPIFNKSRLLYGFFKNKHAIKAQDTALLVEGQMDFLMCYQEGIRHAVATSGTAFTADHLKSLRRLTENILLCFDNDEAGMNAVERSVDLAHAHDFQVKIITLGDYKDPAEVVEKDPKSLTRLLAEAKGAIEFYLHRYLAYDPTRTFPEIKKNTRIILNKIRALSSPIEQSHWIHELSRRTELREEALLEEMAQLREERKTSAPPIPVKIFKPRGRKEIIAERILGLISLREDIRESVLASLEYFPQNYGFMARHILGQESLTDRELIRKLEEITLVASNGARAEDKKELEEYDMLLRELFMEHMKEEKDVIARALKNAENRGDDETVNSLLVQFDELSKLMQNRHK